MTTSLLSAVQLVSDRGFGMHDGDRSDGRHWVGMVVMTLLVAAVVAALVWALGKGRRTHSAVAPAASPTAAAQAILAERLARGEVSPDDYRSLLAVLREDPPTG